MKKIILLLFVSMFAYGQTQTRTGNLQLPQWGAGDTLKSGTKNDPSIHNFSLNNGFARVDSVLSASGMDSSGRFSRLYGKAGLNFIIDAGYGEATPRSIIFNDSIVGLYNQQIYGNSLIRGNVTVGGYITTDSLLLGTGVIQAGDLYPSGNVIAGGYLDADSVYVGGGGVAGKLFVAGIGAFASPATIKYDGSTSVALTIPEVTGTIATVSNSDSLQSPTVHAVLYNSAITSALSLNDTSANFSEWTRNSTSYGTIIRLKYLHKAGIKNVVTRLTAKTTANDWFAQTKIGSLNNATSGTDLNWENSFTTISVAGLTANELYDLTFQIKVNISGTVSFKEIIITAESN